MWSYYGSKSKVVDFYPPPRYGKIIEPFAGSARYSLKWFNRDVLLMDKYEVVIRIWRWLQQCSKQDILKLPNLKLGAKIDRADFDCIEQAWLMGFIVQQGVSSPRLTVSSFAENGIERQKKFIAENLFKIKHWTIQQGSFEDIPNQESTWFIDPPYQFGGEYYALGNKLDYPELGKWCGSRRGQVIVCENTKADWMDFKPMKELTGTKYTTTEAIWSNFETAYDMQQLPLFNQRADDSA